MMKHAWIAAAVAFGFALSAARGATLEVAVMDAAGKPVPDAVISLQPATGAVPSPTTAPHAVMDQRHQEFVPHVLAVQVGTEVKFPNSDNIHHDVYSFSPAKTFELPLYKGVPTKPVLFDKPGVVVLGCNIHDWMLGYIDVVPTPWFAKTGDDGKAGLTAPAGDYTLVLWQPGLVAPQHQLTQSVQLGDNSPLLRNFTVNLSAPMVMSQRPTTTLQHESGSETTPPLSD